VILQSLVRLAEREGLTAAPAYEIREIHWVIDLKADGRFVGFSSLLQPQPEGRKRRVAPRGLKSRVPRQSGRTSRPQEELLVDKAEYVLGLGDRDAKGLKARHKLFVDAAAKAAKETGDVEVATVAKFLAATAQLAAARTMAAAALQAGDLQPNHLIAFAVEGGHERFVHLTPGLRDHCGAVVEEQFGLPQVGQCLVTGQPQRLAKKFSVIKNIPPVKLTKGGIHLTAIDEGSVAYHSYGWGGNSNAPISLRAGFAFVDALNRLLDPEYPDPRDPNRRLPEQRVVLSDNTVAVFWTDDASRVPAAIVPAVAEGDPEAAAALGARVELDASYDALPDTDEEPPSAEPLRSAHEAPWKGIAPQELEDPGAFRLLILSGGQGRATIRAFHTSSVREVVAAVRRWFDDVHVSTLRGRVPLGRLLSSLALRGERKNLPPNLAAETFLAVIEDRPLPFAVLEAAVRRCRSEANTREVQGRAMHDLKVPPGRVALIKAWFNRALRNPALRSQLQGQQVVCEEVKPSMNQDERNKGYLLGRMFACVECMQELALGDVGASVTDRYFSAACATPQAVFPRLLKIEVHHFRKAKEGARGATARWLHGQIGQLAAWLVGGINGLQPGETLEAFQKRTGSRPLRGFPAFMPLPEQGLFALGYHQQRAEFFPRRSAPSTDPASESEHAGPLVAE
jgi:CRISPR-associated protein Csd1